MSPKSKKEYTIIIAKRYRKANIDEKTAILNEYCQVTNCHRKHAIRKLNHFKIYTHSKPKSGRPRKYDSPAILEPLRKIWLTANLPCGKRLQPIALPHIKRDCSQKPIRSDELEGQILDVISKINIPPSFHP